MQTFFISDLHLDINHPVSIDKFIQFLNRIEDDTDALYILGDLFEAWIGDDEIDAGYQPVLAALASLTHRRIPVYFMHGNRDFLLGKDFAEQTGAQYLEDPCVIKLYSQDTLLTHGDLLCTDDSDYQSFRAMVRDKQWQQAFLAKPVSERRALAKQARLVSKTLNRNKPSEIMDANTQAVHAILKQYGTLLLIHGHTHRPGRHQLGTKERIVLGAWHDSAIILRATHENLSLVEI